MCTIGLRSSMVCWFIPVAIVHRWTVYHHSDSFIARILELSPSSSLQYLSLYFILTMLL
nr:MAG TPA: hypothetical protein [Caudoviricetes sp.]